MATEPAAGRAEELRRLLSPVVALLTGALALGCLVTIPDVASGWSSISFLDRAFPAWAGLAVVAAVAVAFVSLLASSRVGPAPPVALGTVAAILGLLLSDDVDAGPQAVAALLTLTVGVGALFGSGLLVSEALPTSWARRTFVAWLLPLAGGWGLLGWVTLHGRVDSVTRLAVHPPPWLVVVAACLILCWALLTLVLEPARPTDPTVGGRTVAGSTIAGWENAWAALAALVAGIACTVMLVGFQPALTTSWVRPLILLTTAVGLAGLVACGWLVPDESARPAYLCLVVALLCGPGSLQVLALVSGQATGRLSVGVGAALGVAGVIGVWAGWRLQAAAMSGGLLLMALAAGAGWVMPSNQWLMVAVAAPFAAGLAAAAGAALRVAGSTPMGVRYVTTGGLAALLFGLLASAPLTWTLGAELTGPLPAARDGGRVLLGLTFAVLVLASAGVSVLVRQAALARPQEDAPDPPYRPSVAPPLT